MWPELSLDGMVMGTGGRQMWWVFFFCFSLAIRRMLLRNDAIWCLFQFFPGSNLVFYSFSFARFLAPWPWPQSSPLFYAHVFCVFSVQQFKHTINGKKRNTQTHKHTHSAHNKRSKNMVLDENAVFTATSRSDTDLITQWLALCSAAPRYWPWTIHFKCSFFSTNLCALNVRIVVVVVAAAATLKITCNNRQAHGAHCADTHNILHRGPSSL